MNFSLHQLAIFHEVAQMESITKAAERMHLTQPAVSIQLKNFQQQFDRALTETIGRRIYLTDFGKEIAEMAETVLERAGQIAQLQRGRLGELTGKLRFAVVSTGKYVMPYFLTDFMHRNPGVELVMDVTNKSQVIESLVENKVDFALVSILPVGLRISNIPLMANQLYLVGDKLPDSKRSDLGLLKELPMIFRESGSGTRLTMEEFLVKQGIHLRKTMELATNEAVKQAILAGLGYSIMPLIGIRDELQSGRLQIIPIDGLPVASVWQLIWLEQKKFSAVAETYLKFVGENKESIIRDQFAWLSSFQH